MEIIYILAIILCILVMSYSFREIYRRLAKKENLQMTFWGLQGIPHPQEVQNTPAYQIMLIIGHFITIILAVIAVIIFILNL